MKENTKIKENIKLMQGLLKEVKPLPRAYIDITKAQIRALKWVLGYKLPKYYLCHRCGSVHIKVECPKCRGGFASPDIEKYFADNEISRT